MIITCEIEESLDKRIEKARGAFYPIPSKAEFTRQALEALVVKTEKGE